MRSHPAPQRREVPLNAVTACGGELPVKAVLAGAAAKNGRESVSQCDMDMGYMGGRGEGKHLLGTRSRT
jgi:hypothetical protein